MSCQGFIVPTVDCAGATQQTNSSTFSAYGEQIVAQLQPAIQVDFTQGIDEDLVECFTSGGGTVTETDSVATVASSSTIGSYAVVRSKRWLDYRAGIGAMARWTSKFSAGVPLSFQLTGLGSLENMLGFGYNGADFGVLRRTGGKAQIVTLILTAANGVGNDITVTLNGVDTVVTCTGSTLASDARDIAEDSDFNGAGDFYNAEFFTDDGGTTYKVVFVARSVDPKSAPARSFGGTGAGSITESRAGAAHSDEWVTQANWNIDPMDGTGPSNLTLDPTKQNLYQVRFQWLGYGRIVWSVAGAADGLFKDVHAYTQVGTDNNIPTLINPNMQIGSYVASLGTTTPLTIDTSSWGAFNQGAVQFYPVIYASNAREPNLDIVDGLIPLLSLKVNLISGNRYNFGKDKLLKLTCAMGGGNNANGWIYVYKDAVLTGADWQAGNGYTLIDTAATAVTGNLIFVQGMGSRTTVEIDFSELDVEWVRGEAISIAIETNDNNTEFNIGATWQETK